MIARGRRRLTTVAVAVAIMMAMFPGLTPCGARAAPTPASRAQGTTRPVPAPQPAAACASGPKRALYVVLEAAVESDLVPMVDRCRGLGYVKLGGVAHAVDVNPGSPAHDRFLQVVIVPAADGAP